MAAGSTPPTPSAWTSSSSPCRACCASTPPRPRRTGCWASTRTCATAGRSTSSAPATRATCSRRSRPRRPAATRDRLAGAAGRPGRRARRRGRPAVVPARAPGRRAARQPDRLRLPVRGRDPGVGRRRGAGALPRARRAQPRDARARRAAAVARGPRAARARRPAGPRRAADAGRRGPAARQRRHARAPEDPDRRLGPVRGPSPGDRPAMVVDHRGLVDQRDRLRPRAAAPAAALGRAAGPRPRGRACRRGRARAGVTGAGAVHPLPGPPPSAVGRVNCCLVDDDPLTLVDAGPNSATSLTVLEAALGEHGRGIEDLERIVITHQHIDHIGLVQILADRSGAEVCALDALAPWLARYSQGMEGDDEFASAIMAQHGIPEDVRYALRAVSAGFRAWGASATVTHELSDGGELGFAGRTWRVWHRPGHSPSDTVFHDEASGLLMGGDHLIKHISSNPLIARPLTGEEGERPKSLRIYLGSLTATREMDLATVLAGHGEPIDDHAA